MLEETHPKVTRNTGQVKHVNAAIFSVTTLQPGTTIETHMLGTAANALYDFRVPDLDALAKTQGVAPIRDIDELVADFWPEDESVEDFTGAVRRWRGEGSRRHD